MYIYKQNILHYFTWFTLYAELKTTQQLFQFGYNRTRAKKLKNYKTKRLIYSLNEKYWLNKYF